jgi:hypothetical protein
MSEKPTANTAQVLSAVPTGNIPPVTFALRVAHISEDQMDAIEAALGEAEKKPGLAKFALSLASPLLLIAKGVEDMSRAVSKGMASPVAALDWWALGTAALVILIGVGAGVALTVQLTNDRKPSPTNELAKKYVKAWRQQLPPPADANA